MPLPVLAALILCLDMAVAVAQTSGRSCAQTRGADAAQRLVDRCIDASPATHPPCNASNPCSLIIDEIRRGCGFLQGADRPGYCRHPDE